MQEKILIFGATGGIGSATARLLHEKGHDLHVVGRDAAKTETLASELSAGWTCGDVTDESLFERVAEEAGSPLAKRIVSNEQMEKGIARMHALPRLGTADDMAALAGFLLSPDSGWITGQIIGVDGGRSTVKSRN